MLLHPQGLASAFLSAIMMKCCATCVSGDADVISEATGISRKTGCLCFLHVLSLPHFQQVAGQGESQSMHEQDTENRVERERSSSVLSCHAIHARLFLRACLAWDLYTTITSPPINRLPVVVPCCVKRDSVQHVCALQVRSPTCIPWQLN
ncbi:hypothetical protein HD554DRAFT_1720481 [Boletus coccyginus]|nr:hypothetical protein HD554DRAFT_1720481 [Boletus coccyginus]